MSAPKALVEDAVTGLPRDLREHARHWALHGLSALSGLSGARARGLARPRVHVLCLHTMYPSEEAAFDRMVGALARDHAFIGYSEAVARIRSGRHERPAIAFTFDDGMRSNLAAARILERHGATACFFVVTGMVGETDPVRIGRFCTDRLGGPPVAFFGWDDLEALQARGHEIGSHTRDHLRLSELSPDAVAEQVGSARATLQARLGAGRHFAWTYGGFADVPPGLGAVVAAAGHESCASAVRGAHVAAAGADPAALCIRRENVLARWPVAHVRWFLARSALAAGPEQNLWPATHTAAA